MLEEKCPAEGKGLTCPSCGSLSIEGGFVEIEAGRACQRMGCTECDATWRDVYEFACRIQDINLDGLVKSQISHRTLREHTY